MPRTEPYDPNAALVLSVLLGVLGIDRFYTGHIGRGLGKLLTLGGLGIWWLVDIVLFIGEVREALRAERGSAVPRTPEGIPLPPAPIGTGLAPWTHAATMTEVIGEQDHPGAFAHLLRDQPRNGSYTKTTATAALASNPGGPRQDEAVSVWIEGRLVGHLARQNASRYAPLLARMAERGQHLSLHATIAGRYDRRQDRWTTDVSLDLPAPEQILPLNTLPAQPHRILPVGPALQVEADAAHREVLASLTGAGERPYAATLHESDGGIEVRIDDRPVGTVRGAEVDALRPLVSHTASLGRLPVARASVHGSAHSPELMLRVCREP